MGYSPWGRKELDMAKVTEHPHFNLMLKLASGRFG